MPQLRHDAIHLYDYHELVWIPGVLHNIRLESLDFRLYTLEVSLKWSFCIDFPFPLAMPFYTQI